MSPKIPQVHPRDISKVLLKNGFNVRPGKGSHQVFVHPDGRRTVLPVHNRPVSTGTLRAILRQSGLTIEDLA